MNYQSGDLFTIGNTTVIAEIIDSSGLSNSCNFTIEIATGYPYCQVGGALTSLVVTELPNNPNTFGAYVEFTTLTSTYHRIHDITAISNDIVSVPYVISASCGLDDVICTQTWKMLIEFDSCSIENQIYSLLLTTECLDDCNLAASNFGYLLKLLQLILLAIFS